MDITKLTPNENALIAEMGGIEAIHKIPVTELKIGDVILYDRSRINKFKGAPVTAHRVFSVREVEVGVGHGKISEKYGNGPAVKLGVKSNYTILLSKNMSIWGIRMPLDDFDPEA